MDDKSGVALGIVHKFKVPRLQYQSAILNSDTSTTTSDHWYCRSKGQNTLLEYGVVELITLIQSLSWWLYQKPCFWGKAHRRMSDFPSSAAKRQDHRRMRELHGSLRFWEIWMQLRARATIGEFILPPMLGPKHKTLSPPSELDHNSRAMRSFAAQTSPGWIPLCCCSSCTWPNSNFFLNCSTSKMVPAWCQYSRKTRPQHSLWG